MRDDEIVITPDGTKFNACSKCGGKNMTIYRTLRDGYKNWKNDQDAYDYWVFCQSCGATGGHAKSGASGAIRMWNMSAEIPTIRLREIIARYARHDDNCTALRLGKYRKPCDCGWNDTVEELVNAKKGATQKI